MKPSLNPQPRRASSVVSHAGSTQGLRGCGGGGPAVLSVTWDLVIQGLLLALLFVTVRGQGSQRDGLAGVWYLVIMGAVCDC